MAEPNKKKGTPPPPPQEKVVVKKRSGCFLLLLLLLLLIALLLYLITHFGWFGLGDGSGSSGDGGSGSDSGTSVADRAEPVSEDTDSTVVYVTISEDKYLLNNEPIELDKLMENIKGIEGDVKVEITDADGVVNLLTDLEDALVAESIAYSVNTEVQETEAE